MLLSSILLGAAALSGVFGIPAPAAEPEPTKSLSVVEKRKNFWFAGVNESGAEFGTGNIPGTKGTDYTWPLTSSVDVFRIHPHHRRGLTFVRERLVPSTLYSGVNSAYLADMKTLVTHITNSMTVAAMQSSVPKILVLPLSSAILFPHIQINFLSGRYYGSVITDTSGFQAFWKTVATQFASNSHVIFDTNNEYHDMDNALVGKLNQAAINGIRSAGATSQTIFVEGNSYTGAWTWVSSGTSTAMGALTDPNNNIIYEMHQYLDSDGSGTSSTCVSTTIGKERLAAATAWLKSNGKNGILGETAAGSNSVCISAITGMLEYMKENNDVWRGWLLWGGGPWWGSYMFSVEPPSGTQYTGVVPSVLKYI
ncbi:glycoside hydrolase family 5 protein [Rutstroemia sp. NJR-2017a WRK4]|nr:glycoside hydrolase family 5 protein [Rutstroemia sp. NJR-2017a WRK4]